MLFILQLYVLEQVVISWLFCCCKEAYAKQIFDAFLINKYIINDAWLIFTTAFDYVGNE